MTNTEVSKSIPYALTEQAETSVSKAIPYALTEQADTSVSKGIIYVLTEKAISEVSKSITYALTAQEETSVSKATAYALVMAPDLSGDLYQYDDSKRPTYSANDPPTSLPTADNVAATTYFHVWIDVAGPYRFFIMFDNGNINEFTSTLSKGENVLDFGFDFTQIFAVYAEPPLTPLVRDKIREAMTAANPT